MCIYIIIYIGIYVYIYTGICIYKYMNIHRYTYIYIHTPKSTNIHILYRYSVYKGHKKSRFAPFVWPPGPVWRSRAPRCCRLPGRGATSYEATVVPPAWGWTMESGDDLW